MDERVLIHVPAFEGFSAAPWFGVYSGIRQRWEISAPFLIGGKQVMISGGPHPTHWMPAPEPPNSSYQSSDKA
jgi:hypothetical protein